jgi:adenylate cyclase
LDVVGWLKRHFEAIGDAVMARAKFSSSWGGLLAVFPVSSPDAHPCLICEHAVRAAEEAIAANAELNRQRAAAESRALKSTWCYISARWSTAVSGRRADWTSR